MGGVALLALIVNVAVAVMLYRFRRGDSNKRSIWLCSRGANAGYIVGDTEHYEQTATVEARFDRMLVYRSRLLHFGRIDSETTLSSDPRRGWLTANVFVNYRPARRPRGQ